MANIIRIDRSKISTVRDFDSEFSGRILSIVQAGLSKAGNAKLRVTVVSVEGQEEVKKAGKVVTPAVEEQTQSGIVMAGTFATKTAWAKDAYTVVQGTEEDVDLDYFCGLKAERVVTNPDSLEGIKPTDFTVTPN